MVLPIFTTILLTIIHLHSTLASPVVSEGGVVAGQSLDLPRSIEKRYVPLDQQCSNAVYWVSRVCRPTYGDRFWDDNCSGPGVPGGQIVKRITNFCKGNTICSNIIRENKMTIECIARPTVFNNIVTDNQQSGVTEVGTVPHGNRQYTVSVDITYAIKLASVSAFLEDQEETYVVAATKAIVGSLRSTKTKTCSYNVTNRDCVPSGRYNLKSGNTIDFTFGLGMGQAVKFYYAIVGS